MIIHISKELKNHAPFTIVGALTGIVLMLVIIYAEVPTQISHHVFYVLHPLHIVLSALVTAAMYRKHQGQLFSSLVIGYVGSIGIATISDILFPYLGAILLGVSMELHFAFIEKWWLVNTLAILGSGIGVWWQRTQYPHSGHVLLSTWASLFYLTAFSAIDWVPLFPVVFLILFFAVWIPCCLSDIIFPLLFVKDSDNG